MYFFAVDLVHLFPSDLSDLEFTIDCDLVIVKSGASFRNLF